MCGAPVTLSHPCTAVRLLLRLHKLLASLEELLKLTLLKYFCFCIKCMLGHIWNTVCNRGVLTWPGTLKVQRRATKHVYGPNSLPYEGRLEKLQLYSLFCRSQRGDMIETYKILKNYYNIEPSLFFTLNDSSTTRVAL